MDWKYARRLGGLSGALALSACMMPYDAGQYQAPPPPAYSADENPDGYAYIDRADSLWEAVGDAPPDYAFAFEGAAPWAWELQDGYRIVVEENADGIQSYYFAPGESGPFLAVRPGMSFGFEGETVAVVYGPDGGAMPRDVGAAHLGEGVALYARGRELLRAMLQKQWREVDSQAWIDTGPILWSSVAIWDEGRRRHPGWGRHRDGVRDAEWRRRLELERIRRAALAEQFRRWREGGFQGPPPGRFHRPGAHGPGAGRPDRPGEPGAGRPRQPGQYGGPRGPGAGRPRPGAGQPVPGLPRGPRRPDKLGPDDSGVVAPDTPQTVPTPGAGVQRRPGWGGRPRPDRAPGTPDASAQPDSVTPRPEGRRPGWYPDVAPGAGTAAPSAPRPDGRRPGWYGRRPDAAPGTGTAEPSAPRPPRPEGGRWGGRRPDAAPAGSSAPPPVRYRAPDAPRPERSAPPQRSSEPRAAPPPRPTPSSAAGPKGRVDRGGKVDD